MPLFLLFPFLSFSSSSAALFTASAAYTACSAFTEQLVQEVSAGALPGGLHDDLLFSSCFFLSLLFSHSLFPLSAWSGTSLAVGKQPGFLLGLLLVPGLLILFEQCLLPDVF